MTRNIVLFTFLLTLGNCFCQAQENDVVGSWRGSLNIQSNKSYSIVFNISEENGVLVTKMDSPDQGAKGIPTESTTLSGNEVEIKMPALQAQYKGIVEDRVTMKGTFTQMGMEFPLELTKQPEVKKGTPAVQDPNVGKYTSAEVKFKNQKDRITLAGTVTYPNGKTNCPAVILLTGSGVQDRDETLFGQKPFLRIADRLSANGIAVLRFDDRGFAGSEGDIKVATTYDFVTDALAAYEFMKTYPGIDSTKIGLAGHSEGADVAAMAAAENKDIAFIVMLAGATLPGDSILCLQAAAMTRAAGVGEESIKTDYEMRSGIYNIIKSEPDNDKASEKISLYVNSLPGFTGEQKKALIQVFTQAALSPWMRSFISYDPAPYLAKVSCPAITFWGGKDLQVPAKENIAGLMNIIYENKKNNFSIVEIDGVNHLFQKAEKGMIGEYSNEENAVMNDEILDKLQDWLTNYLR
ncbi:MAG: alpha/beta fold hydrolase [Dysgonamonadaceae bacterium]|jgi:dienelactone hydrolase|nr:alpha/beta fold hydrolase [Dysgonamonadaceae bacterium]